MRVAAKVPSDQQLCFERRVYWIVLATEENALLALLPTRRIVPTTSTKITASITAYSAMSWPCSSFQSVRRRSSITLLSWLECFQFEGRADEKIRILTLKTRN